MENFKPETNPIFHRSMLTILTGCLKSLPQTESTSIWSAQKQAHLETCLEDNLNSRANVGAAYTRTSIKYPAVNIFPEAPDRYDIIEEAEGDDE